MEDEYKFTFENDLVQVKVKKWTQSTRKMAKSIAGWMYNETKTQQQKAPVVHKEKKSIAEPKKDMEKKQKAKPKKINKAEVIGKDIYRVALKNAWILGKEIPVKTIAEKSEKDKDTVMRGLAYLIDKRKARQLHDEKIQFY